MDQGVTRRGVGGLEAHGQRPQAALVGASKRLAVLQQAAVQMEADVSLQTLRETLQHLRRNTDTETISEPGTQTTENQVNLIRM